LEAWVKNLRKQSATPRADDLPPTLEGVSIKVEALAAAIAIDGQEQKWHTVCLALATGLSTLFWGFGDWIAGHFIATVKPPCS
jgi:hypothetical protein